MLQQGTALPSRNQNDARKSALNDARKSTPSLPDNISSSPDDFDSETDDDHLATPHSGFWHDTDAGKAGATRKTPHEAFKLAKRSESDESSSSSSSEESDSEEEEERPRTDEDPWWHGRKNPNVTHIISGIDPKTNHFFDGQGFEWPDVDTAVKWRRNRSAIASNTTSAAIKLNTALRMTKKKEAKKDTMKKTVNSKEIRRTLPRQTAQV